MVEHTLADAFQAYLQQVLAGSLGWTGLALAFGFGCLVTATIMRACYGR